MVTKRSERVSARRHIAKFAWSLNYVLRKDKPRLLYRTAYNYLYYLARGVPRLRYVDLAVTYRCDLSCIHCSATRLHDPDRTDMTPADYAVLGDQLADCGVLVVQLTGGEPLVRTDLEDIIQALNPSRFLISMGTNTKRATPERLISLRKAGLDNLCISMDDWDAAEHDRWRREEGVHERALETLDVALGLGYTAMIFTVATHQNVRSENLLRLIEYAASKRVLLLIGWAVPTGKWNANLDILLTPDDLAYIEQLHERYPHVRTDFEANYFNWGCGAGKEKLYITPYGDVVPCAFVHIRFGNVFDKSLATIRETAMRIDWFRKYNALCLAANDREFQQKHMAPIFEAEHEPISMREAGFDLDE